MALMTSNLRNQPPAQDPGPATEPEPGLRLENAATGFRCFDAISDGGLLRGRAIPVRGSAGTGVAVVSAQVLPLGRLAWAMPVVRLSFEALPGQLVASDGERHRLLFVVTGRGMAGLDATA